jgi:uncharacterized repeat protein (TIGR02543 family)
MVAMIALPMFGQTTLNISGGGGDQKMGSGGGYDYELWSQNGAGNSSMTITASDATGGSFTCKWSGTINMLARAGKRWGSNSTTTVQNVGNITAEFDVEWSSTDNVKYVSVYGWGWCEESQKPSGFTTEIEYYIIQDRGSYNPTQGGSYKGSATIDGIEYDFYTTDRINQPSLSGTSTFKQYWSIPKNTSQHRTSGTISISKHFAAWANVGMPMGKLYEVASMKIESYTGQGGNANGQANVKKNILRIGGSADEFTLDATASPAVGGTITKSPSSNYYKKNSTVELTATANEGWKFVGWEGITASGNNASVTMTKDLSAVAKFELVGTSTTNILKDGNFPSGSIGDQGSWRLNTGSAYGNSAATSTISGGKATINVTTTGTEVYEPQLVQTPVELEKGMKYRLTFTASASAARTMEILFQKATADYDTYAQKEFDLTTSSKDYTFEFEMTNDSDLSAQLAFNLGAAATSVTLSDIKLVHIKEFTKEAVQEVTLTLDPSGGTISGETSITVEKGAAVGTLPTPTRSGYEFLGWFDANKNEYTATTILNANATVTASWKELLVVGPTEEELMAVINDLKDQVAQLTSERDNLQQLLDECYNSQTTSEESLRSASSNLIVYPNPVSANSVLSIESVSLKTGDTIEIFNMQGQRISVSVADNDAVTSVKIGSLAKGIYLLRLAGEKGIKFEVK